MTTSGPRQGRLIDAVGRPWVYWSIGVAVVATVRIHQQGASWWAAAGIGLVAAAVVAVVLRSLRRVDLGRLRSNRAVRSVLAHFRGDRDDSQGTAGGRGDDTEGD